MDFDLTEELKMLKDMAYKFAVAEFTPLSKECDEHEKYTPEVRIKAAENGLVGAWIPEEYGGAGAGILGNTIITEELSKVDMGIGLNVVAATFGCESIFQYGSEEQKQAYLPPVCRGEWVSAGSFTEPNAGTDVAGYKTRAVKDGSDYIINGNKIFISNGARANWIVVAAKTDKEAGYDGITEFIVDSDTPGFEVSRKLDKVGLRSSDTAELFFTDMRVPASAVLGEVGKGFYQIMSNFQPERLLIAISAYSGAERALEMAIDYAKERKQFGKAISRHQHNAFKIAELATKIEAAKELTYRAADMYNRGLDCLKEVSMAKWYATEMSNEVAYHAMQLMGGYGYMMEYPMQRAWRDLRVQTIVGGTTEVQKLIISRCLGL
ncbi:MAG: acyl-CoA dehydrogenase [Deltaproteobacteria bacterium HGW-Deltaproteobacteria-11]|nr:MAG: acyl-CoA dehydrogenase [Deltaproteobacteria bacterium HGW-Deltaproteobacteria-11]